MNHATYREQTRARKSRLEEIKEEREQMYRDLMKQACKDLDFQKCEMLDNQRQIERDTFARAIHALNEALSANWETMIDD